MAEVSLPGGARASYEVVGRGQPLLCFPGGPGFPSIIVREDAELLADHFEVYLVDPPGTGASTPAAAPEDYSHLGHARFYDEVRRALGLGTVTIHGVSFGAVCALTFAALFPDTVARCIGVSGFGIGVDVDAAEGGEGAAQMERLLARHEGADWYEEARHTLDRFTETALAADDPAVFKHLGDVIMPLYVAYPDRPDVAERLERRKGLPVVPNVDAIKHWESGLYQSIDLRPLVPEIRAPVLLIAGELDFITGPVQARAIAREIPRCDLVVLPECGHVPATEEPGAYRKVMLDWVATH
ncbi:MAG TPA: alpha/beta hydrolase [Actinomycetota bacterium]|jgi:pimeloyl-ACP methyl ester carboxylesterase